MAGDSNSNKKKKQPRVTKKDIVDIMHSGQKGKDIYLPKYILADIVDCIFGNITKAMLSGDIVEIRGFGKFNPLRFGLDKGQVYNTVEGKYQDGIKMWSQRVFRPSKELLIKMNGGRNNVFEQYFGNNSNS